MLVITTDGKKVSKNIKSAFKKQAVLHNEFQQAAIDTIWHAATHGDPSLLNVFYTGLSATYQASFKRWVSHEVAGRYPAGTKSNLFWLGMVKDQFVVKKGTADERTTFVEHVDSKVAAANASSATAQDKAYGRFFEMDPTKVQNAFDDTALAKKLFGLMKSATKADSEVSATAIDGLKAAIHEFQKVTGIDAAAVH